jgi:hypothetical protein
MVYSTDLSSFVSRSLVRLPRWKLLSTLHHRQPRRVFDEVEVKSLLPLYHYSQELGYRPYAIWKSTAVRTRLVGKAGTHVRQG